jgi:hypothetical protein
MDVKVSLDVYGEYVMHGLKVFVNQSPETKPRDLLFF